VKWKRTGGKEKGTEGKGGGRERKEENGRETGKRGILCSCDFF